MNESIYLLSQKLNESLNNNPKIIHLNELEKKLNDSYEVYLLSKRKDECLENYSRLKDIYPSENNEVINSLKELKKAKEELVNHPLVKEYLSIYNEVRDLYLEIDSILFSDFSRGC